MEHENVLKSAKVMTTDGRELGKLVEVYFDEQTGQIEGYGVSGDLVTVLLSGRSFVPVSLIVKVSQEVALVKPEVADIVEMPPNRISGATQADGGA
jgi:uncharacterized protein YrrD